MRFVRDSRSDPRGAIFAPLERHDGSRPNGRGSAQPSLDAPNRLHLRNEHDRFREQLATEGRGSLARRLGVTPACLTALQVGWATASDLRKLRAGGAGWSTRPPDGAFTFPERDAEGCIVGFSLRTIDDRKGSPSSDIGARRGLIVPDGFETASGPVLVVEGATDVAAALTLELRAVGRPSNASGVGDLTELLCRVSDVLILGENDCKRTGAFPGRDGMQAVARQLARAWHRSVPCALPPQCVKDVRAWLQGRVAGGLDLQDSVACGRAGLELLVELTDCSESVPPDLALPGSVAAWRPFPTELLPEPLLRFVSATGRSIDCDESMVAIAVLVACAGQIGNARRVLIKRGYTQPSVLWGAIVGGSGSAKSPALDAAFAPIREDELRCGEEHDQARRRYEREQVAYLETRKSGVKLVANGEVPARPDEPRRERRLVDDLTLEGLRGALVDSPRGVTCCRDELAGWLDSHDSYRDGKGGDLSRWLSMFDAGPLIALRADASRCADVPHAAVSLIGGIQPGPARRRFTRENIENGLLARMLVVAPPRRLQRWSDFEVSGEVSGAYARVLRSLGSLPLRRGSAGDSLPPREVRLSPGAVSLFRDFANEVGDRVFRADDDEGANWSKLRNYAARLALVDHSVRFVVGETADEWTLASRSMTVGIELARWFGHEAERMLSTLAESREERALRRDAEWVERRNGVVTAGDLIAKGPRPRPGTAREAEARLRRMADAGFGEVRFEHSARGPAALTFRIHVHGSGSEFGPGGPKKAELASTSSPGHAGLDGLEHAATRADNCLNRDAEESCSAANGHIVEAERLECDGSGGGCR
ncbi:MAG: DUF3987 domain-containing protein [Planctomycetes bacterium]|nr:DUF3987 domain-containing protein [Planctomycetota bacterium]